MQKIFVFVELEMREARQSNGNLMVVDGARAVAILRSETNMVDDFGIHSINTLCK